LKELDPRDRRTLEAAERVAALLGEYGADCALIGALALAVHGYPRSTGDVDLATATDPYGVLAKLSRQLRDEGFEVRFNEPDAQDQLGGMLNIERDDIDPVQVVNFLNPFTAGISLGREAVEAALPLEGSSLRVVDLPHLIALKLFAGGPKSQADVEELLARNTDVDLDSVRSVCRSHGLEDELEAVLGTS